MGVLGIHWFHRHSLCIAFCPQPFRIFRPFRGWLNTWPGNGCHAFPTAKETKNAKVRGEDRLTTATGIHKGYPHRYRRFTMHFHGRDGELQCPRGKLGVGLGLCFLSVVFLLDSYCESQVPCQVSAHASAVSNSQDSEFIQKIFHGFVSISGKLR